MPPKVQFRRQDVLDAAFRLVRERGMEALNARAVAKKLGCSTQPIFREFRSMDELRQETLAMARDAYSRSLASGAARAPTPYLGTGLAYILFAREEPELFKLLFMRDRVSDGTLHERDEDNIGYILSLVMERTGLARGEAEAFHLRLWIYVHGLATMLATKFVVLDEEQLLQLLRDEFEAMRRLYAIPDAPPRPASACPTGEGTK